MMENNKSTLVVILVIIDFIVFINSGWSGGKGVLQAHGKMGIVRIVTQMRAWRNHRQPAKARVALRAALRAAFNFPEG
jgi:hypothetical protein